MLINRHVSVGQENLDSLCRMMEEIAILRDHNNKLQDRLQYMEVRETSKFSEILGKLLQIANVLVNSYIYSNRFQLELHQALVQWMGWA